VINEVCISQGAYFLCAARELAFAPRLHGIVRGKGRPAEVLARFAGTDQLAARGPLAENGDYSLTLPGGGWYDIVCGPVRRCHFVATSSDCRLDLDLEREVVVSLDCPEEVRPGTPFELRVEVKAVGREAVGRHTLDLRLHSLTCAEPHQQVDTGGKRAGVVSFTLNPERATEPFLVLVVPDGQVAKRAECMGVVSRSE